MPHPSGDVAASVILPTFNQDSRLALTLTSLARQQPPGRRWELIVVDDGSTDGTAAVLDQFAKRLPMRVIRQRNAGRSAARNAGAELAAGRSLVFCDGDRICDPAFVAEHIDAAADDAADDADTVSMGEIREIYLTDLDGRKAELLDDISRGCPWLRRQSRRPHFVAEIQRHLIGPDAVASTPLAWMCFLSGNVSLPRKLFGRAGGFDEDFVEWGFEHFELGYRLAQAGAVFRYRQAAANYHVAHRRPPGFYQSGIAASAELLRRKQPRLPVDALVGIVSGTASIADLLAVTGPGAVR